jgi:glycosyltransferase involved in cell wall biosynthesis
MMDASHDMSNASPLVSVIVPLYDGSAYIESTLKSVLSQSFSSYEILVIDDGSTDDGPAKVSNLQKSSPERIRLLHHPDRGNHGIAASRNLGIRNSVGTLIAFLDQDDLWLPQRLQREVAALQHFPKAALVYAQCAYIDEHGVRTSLRGMHPLYGRGDAGGPRNVFSKLIKEDFIPNLTVLVRKSCLERVGLLDEGPRYEYEDWLLLSKLAYFYQFIFIPEVLAEWRVHSRNYSAYVFETGRLTHADEHYTVTLFSFLMNQNGVRYQELRKFLRRRIWLFLLRARSWGATREAIETHASNLINAFPQESRMIRRASSFAAGFPTRFSSVVRRLRRIIVGT